MPYHVSYTANGQEMQISIANQTRTRVVLLMVTLGCVMLINAAFFIREFVQDGWSPFVVVMCSLVVTLIAARNYFKSITQRELLVITKQEITIIKTNFFKKRARSYKVRHIADFRLPGRKAEYAPHPLGGQTVDYMGHNMMVREGGSLASDNRLSFFYDGRNVEFGNKILESEAEELFELITGFTGSRMQQDEELARWRDDVSAD